jgi:hypothetical protein
MMFGSLSVSLALTLIVLAAILSLFPTEEGQGADASVTKCLPGPTAQAQRQLLTRTGRATQAVAPACRAATAMASGLEQPRVPMSTCRT